MAKKKKWNHPCGACKDPRDVRRSYPYERKDSGPYWANIHRKRKITVEGDYSEPRRANVDQFPEPVPAEDSDELAAVKHVVNNGSLEKLPPRQKRAFKLVFIEGLTYAETSRRMAISPVRARQLAYEAAKKIKKYCEDLI